MPYRRFVYHPATSSSVTSDLAFGSFLLGVLLLGDAANNLALRNEAGFEANLLANQEGQLKVATKICVCVSIGRKACPFRSQVGGIMGEWCNNSL